MPQNRRIMVCDAPIMVSQTDFDDYICITDIAAAKSDNVRAADVVKNWIRNRNTLEFLGTWEQMYNGGFKVVEFDHFKRESGLHTFVLSVSEWVEKTNAIGLGVK
ncbi:MAG: KilA-N domain-containing protein [Lachnospiraceae bacterium]|nr:KilA-N domain-containing protein [Lachnospiraceae bacterium]